MKKWYIECPYCKNEIKEWAVKCQYCHEYLDKEQAPDKDHPGQTIAQTKAVKKKSNRIARIIIWVVVFIIILSNLWGNDNNTTPDNTIWLKVQARVNTINNQFGKWWVAERDKFEKAMCVWDCNNAEISLYFSSKLNKDVDWVDEDNVARWQAFNLASEIDWKKATVNVYVNWALVEKCVTKNWEKKVDYCEINWEKVYNQY